MNEVLQWSVIVVLAVFVLGVLRQISLMLPSESRAATSGPPLYKPLPRAALTEIRRASNNGGLIDGSVLAFVAESCVACQRLLADLSANPPLRLEGHLTLVARKPTEQFMSALMQLEVPIVADHTGEIWKACEVSATPLLVKLDSKGQVIEKEVSHHVDSFADQNA